MAREKKVDEHDLVLRQDAPAVIAAEVALPEPDGVAPEGWERVDLRVDAEDLLKDAEPEPAKEEPLPIMNPAHRAELRAQRRANRPSVADGSPDVNTFLI